MSEFRGRVPMLLASIICFAVGMGATMFYGIGAFIPSLQSEFGWSRSEISFGATIMSTASLLFGTVVGQLSDRFGAHRVAAASYAAYGAAIMIILPLLGGIGSFWLFSFLVAMMGQGSTPVVLVRPVISAFRTSRGLALGIVATGSGLGAFWVPRVVSEVTAAAGWRAAYLTIGSLAIATAPIAWIWLRDGVSEDKGDAQVDSGAGGYTMRQAARLPRFWVMSAISLAMASAVSGVVIHSVPFLRDDGLDPITAASMASLAGLASMIGRVAMGALLDCFDTVAVSIAALTCAVVGVGVLWVGGAEHAAPALLLVGFAIGAETDMIAFMTARLFGKAHYGVLFGWLFSLFTVGYGLSPFFIGWVRDSWGTYGPAFAICIALLTLSIGLICSLGPHLRRLQFD
ncbi:MFS transporter [Novosphingobium sp. JCM 18896]|uniref:MFS transporter n=1 Tax=Novosphingobium sp. JCM 18896 TaxID=2989731 RepID=UPI002222321A|nr:MFS transporter [Novosphingobium sp. JCM 18896]MCW1432305.1 MFS transporter [Novosphingobium sp. JCM 18896]